jgi:CRISPR system Cascade subunit CasD
MTARPTSLVLRLAGPVQSWGTHSQFNRRQTSSAPTKSGIIGLLAAAQGRRRQDPIEDLLALQLGVRTDRPGSLLRDYHTVSDYRGWPLPSAAVTAKGAQKPTAPAKHTHVTERFYLQDAAFVVAVHAGPDVLDTLRQALQRPAFPLALGRRACAPTQPLILTPSPTAAAGGHQHLWNGDHAAVLAAVPWQGPTRRARRSDRTSSAYVDLPVTLDDPDGDDTRLDVPRSFDPRQRGFTTRTVRQSWVRVATGSTDAGYVESGPVDAGTAGAGTTDHDPFALLGW